MRRSLGVLTGIVVGTSGPRLAIVLPAHADPTPDPRDVFDLPAKRAAPPDPRDVFGLPPKRNEPPPSCDDKRAFGCVIATDPLDDSVPYALSTWLPTSYLRQLPVADATHDAVAHYALGAARDEAGVFFGGANGLENRWTIDGAPAESARTGGVDTRVPLAFLDGIRVTAGGFAARDRASTGGTIDAVLRRGTAHHEVDARLWGTWGATPSQRAIAPNTFQLRRLSTHTPVEGSAAIVATGPLAPLGRALGGTAWYVAGVAPTLALTNFTWKTARLVDLDGDNLADHDDDAIITTDPIGRAEQRVVSWFVPAIARIGLDRGHHHVELSLIGNVGADERHFTLATPQAGGIDRLGIVGDAIATWRGTWKTTRARFQLAWHHSSQLQSAHDPAAADLPQLLSGYVPANLADEPDLSEACRDVDPTMFRQCAIPAGLFASGGAGLLVDQIADHPTATADIAHQIGNNVLRAGGTFEDVRLVTRSRYTGGSQIRSLFEGHHDEARFRGTGDCSEEFGGACDILDTSELNYRTRYTAAYVENTFHPSRDIAVDGGIRWELMWVGTALHFSKQIAPRLGLSWDVLGGGRSRLWTSMGRSYAFLPAGLGASLIPGDRRVRDITIASLGTTRTLETGAALPVEADLAPMTQDELTAGLEIGLARTLRVTGWIQGRWLRSAIESAGNRLRNPTDGDHPATRASTIVAAELATTPAGVLALRLGYMFGRTVGSVTGAFDPRQGATLYDGSDYDGDLENLFGRLPTDIGHRVYIEAVRRGHLAGIPVAVSSRLTLNSGRPRNVLAINGGGVAELLPRGSYGRGPMIAQTNVELLARWRGLDITLDVFNLFDQRVSTNLDEVYTTRTVRPIDHGTPSDLVFVKTEAGNQPSRNPSFQYPTVFQAPIAATLGIRRAF